LEPLEYLRILRRRWGVVALAVLVGLGLGWFTAPGTASKEPKVYRAKHVLIVTAGNENTLNLPQAALLVTTGSVPEKAAAELGVDDPVGLTKQVTAEADIHVGTVTVTGQGTDPAKVEHLADVFAETLVTELGDQANAAFVSSLNDSQKRADDLKAQLNDVDTQLAALPANAASGELRAQQGALTSQYQTALSTVSQLNDKGAPLPPLQTLQKATAEPVKKSGIQAPRSKPMRALLLGLVGLVLGVGGSLLAERLDIRVRGKSDAEHAFGFPVIAEIPRAPTRGRHRAELYTETRPASPYVEAYRALRTVVLFASSVGMHATNGNGHSGTNDKAGDHKVILVVSPSAGEGKTTSVAHLAAVLAEIGKTVLVVGADFRRPRIHDFFGGDRVPGLSDVLGSPDSGFSLTDLDTHTDVARVKILASGTPVENPAPLIHPTGELIRAARPLFDFVIVDTAPLLVANDASELIAHCDMVVVLSRADRSSRESAHRAAELLQRLDAPVLGSVIIGASDTPTAYSYYRYRYYAEAESPPWWRRLFGGKRQSSRDAKKRKRRESSERADDDRDRDERDGALDDVIDTAGAAADRG
jgi:capsular exopolysaccharide synthesis family protein